MLFLDEQNKKIGDGHTEPDWTVWRAYHYEDTLLEDGSVDESKSVTYCRRITDEEIEEETRQELIGLLPDAVADLSQAVSEGNAELCDAIAELSELVSNLVEGMNDNG